MSVKYPISFDFNQKNNAKMVDFNGWMMPTFYSGIIAEHSAVRRKLGLFDVSHMGRQKISGKDSRNFLSKIVCNNVDIEVGRAVYSPMLNNQGGIIDDLIIYKIAEGDYLVVNNAGNHEQVCAWYAEQSENFTDLKIEDITLEIGQIAVQGPEAASAVDSVLKLKESPKYFSHTSISYDGEEIMISATGYTGERGYELYAKPELLMKIWQTLISDYGALACGLGARDLLRLEAGYCLHGNDINANTSPIEAGLAWTVKNNGDYVGGGGATRRHKRLTVLALTRGEKILPRSGLEVFNMNGQIVGRITSGNYSPSLERAIALAYIEEEYYKNVSEDGKVLIKIRDKTLSAQIGQPWFYRNIRGKEIQELDETILQNS